MSYHRSFVPDKRSLIKLLQQARDFSINLYDTAEAYGPFVNETLVGEALTPFFKEIMIATKFGFKEGKPRLGLDIHPKRIRQVLENSLRSLRTDYIDLFYQHHLDSNIPIEDVAGTVKNFIAEGKVRFFGMSEAGSETIRQAHRIQPLTALQSEYSLMTRAPENDVINVCEELRYRFCPLLAIKSRYAFRLPERADNLQSAKRQLTYTSTLSRRRYSELAIDRNVKAFRGSSWVNLGAGFANLVTRPKTVYRTHTGHNKVRLVERKHGCFNLLV